LTFVKLLAIVGPVEAKNSLEDIKPVPEVSVTAPEGPVTSFTVTPTITNIKSFYIQTDQIVDFMISFEATINTLFVNSSITIDIGTTLFPLIPLLFKTKII